MRLSELSFLIESKGFINRQDGDIYVNPTDPEDQLYFKEVLLYPEEANQFVDIDERDQLVAKVMAFHGDVYIANPGGANYKPPSNMLALYVVRMENHQEEDNPKNEYYVKFIQSKARVESKFNKIDANIKYPGHPGYLYSSKAAQSEQFNIKPSDVLPSDRNMDDYESQYRPESIPDLVASTPKDVHIPEDLKDQMIDYLNNAVSGDIVFTIKNGFKHRSTHEKYLGEWAAPIAVIKGQVINPEVLRRAEKDLMYPDKFSQAKILYPTDPTQKLVDSYVIGPLGKRVGISSKTRKSGGAAASITGLWDILERKKDNSSVKVTKKMYPEAIKLIETIVKYNQREGPLELGKQLEIINEEDAKIVLDMIENITLGEGEKNNYKNLSKTLQRLVNNKGANFKKNNYNIGFHALTAVAYEVANRVKNSHSMKFTDAIRAILTHDDFIQVYANSKKHGDDLEFGHFKVVYPSIFKGRVELNVSKSYMATGIKGKMGFKFK